MHFSVAIAPLVSLLVLQAAAEPLPATLVGRDATLVGRAQEPRRTLVGRDATLVGRDATLVGRAPEPQRTLVGRDATLVGRDATLVGRAQEPRRTLVGRQAEATSLAPTEANLIYTILPVSNDPDVPAASSTAEGDQLLTILPVSVATPAPTSEQIFSILPTTEAGEGIVDLNPTTTRGNSSVTASSAPGQSIPAGSGSGKLVAGLGAVLAAGLVGVAGLL